MLSFVVLVQTVALGLADRVTTRVTAHLPSSRRPGDRGQATAEYAIVVVGAAVVGFLLITWATSGNGASKVGRLLDRVVDKVASTVS